MLEFWNGIPEEFRWHSRAKHLESQQNFDGIPLEYWRNTVADFVQIYHMLSRIIPMKFHSFFCVKNRNSCGIFGVFWWDFCGIFSNLGGILIEFLWYFPRSKKQWGRPYLRNLTSILVEFFVFSHPATLLAKLRLMAL